jgi:hypothetical protein
MGSLGLHELLILIGLGLIVVVVVVAGLAIYLIRSQRREEYLAPGERRSMRPTLTSTNRPPRFLTTSSSVATAKTSLLGSWLSRQAGPRLHYATAVWEIGLEPTRIPSLVSWRETQPIRTYRIYHAIVHALPWLPDLQPGPRQPSAVPDANGAAATPRPGSL